MHGLLFAVDTNVVKEILWLPELTLIEECPSYIAGVINMHGKIVPVMDLNIRFGNPPQRYGLSDRVIILHIAELGTRNPELKSALGDSAFRAPHSAFNLLGIIVNDVLDVIDIPEEHIEPPPFHGSEIKPHPYFVSGQAKAGEKIIMILDHRTILDVEFEIEEPEIEESEIIPQSAIRYFCPEADQQEREMFHQRAIHLHYVVESEDSTALIPVAVIGLNSEYLCVELESVREFSRIHNFTPVPCCPEHIAGNMNLRGNVLTVVDIRSLLNMQAGKISETTKVIVADTGEFPAGVIVDEILDVIYLRREDIAPVTNARKAISEKFIKGAAPYSGKMMAILDFKEILSWDGLIVNEEA
jgi:purine-binding chemotaxis protein CheW